MAIDTRMAELAASLPEQSGRGRRTIREICLTRYDDGTWRVMAGGHSSVHIGEWGGDFSADGTTAYEAIANCEQQIAGTR